MEMLTLIAILSCVMWYIIDRFKELWENIVIHKFVTVAVAAALALAVSFGYGLDIIFALGAWPQATTLGIVLTALLLMTGSSGVDAIMEKIKGKTKNIKSE